MTTLTGLFDHMVLQRSALGVSQAAFTGRCATQGSVVVRVLRGGKPVRGFAVAVVGTARDGRFKGKLRGLPTGGPYQVELAIVDGRGKPLESLVVKDVLVGDVWVAAGQSNMVGRGITRNGPGPHPLVRAFYMDDHWAVARDQIHNIEIAVDAFHNGGVRVARALKAPRGAGPAIGFARAMHRLTGAPQGIIASAHGGTSMAQWDPALKPQGGKSLYGANLRRCLKNGGRVAGVIWYQGESDAESADDARLYTPRMKNLIAAFRRDLRAPALPIVVVQIARLVDAAVAPEPWNSVQDQQRRLPEIIRRVGVVSAIDLDLDDLTHIAGSAQERLGRRMAYAMNALVRGRRGGKPPIALRRVTIHPTVSHVTQDLVLEFDNVEGNLVSAGRPMGFALGNPRDTRCIYRTDLEGNKVILRTTLQRGGLDGKSIHYGLGTDPACNITDAQDRGLLVMGPIAIAPPRALTAFVQSARVAGPLPGRGKLRDLAYPGAGARLKWRRIDAVGNFLDIRAEIEPLQPADHLYYFRCRVHCAEEMVLGIHLGYDGPVKLWVDGRETYADPHGKNPATPERAKPRVTAAAGTHEVLVALGTNHGQAWGIFLRFERLDLSPKVIAMGRAAFRLPSIVGA